MKTAIINSSGPAHLVGLTYSVLDPLTVPVLEPDYIAVKLEVEPPLDLQETAPFLDEIFLLNGRPDWSTTSWAGVTEGFTYAMPTSWFTFNSSPSSNENENKPD